MRPQDPQDGRIDGEKEAVGQSAASRDPISHLNCDLVDLEIVARKLGGDGRCLCLGSKPVLGIRCGLLAHVTTPLSGLELEGGVTTDQHCHSRRPATMIVYAAVAPRMPLCELPRSLAPPRCLSQLRACPSCDRPQLRQALRLASRPSSLRSAFSWCTHRNTVSQRTHNAAATSGGLAPSTESIPPPMLGTAVQYELGHAFLKGKPLFA